MTSELVPKRLRRWVRAVAAAAAVDAATVGVLAVAAVGVFGVWPQNTSQGLMDTMDAWHLRASNAPPSDSPTSTTTASEPCYMPANLTGHCSKPSLRPETRRASLPWWQRREIPGRPAVTGSLPCPAGWLCVAPSRLFVSGFLLWVGALRRSAPVVLWAAGWGLVAGARWVSVRLRRGRGWWAEVLRFGGGCRDGDPPSPAKGEHDAEDPANLVGRAASQSER